MVSSFNIGFVDYNWIDKNNVASITTIKSKQPKSSSNRSRSIFVCKDSTKSMINSKSSIIPKQKMLSKLSTNSTAPFLSEPSYKNNSSVSKSTIKCQKSKVWSKIKWKHYSFIIIDLSIDNNNKWS